LNSIPLVGNFVLLAILFNFILAVFNLLPIPPLDGSRMVYASLKSTASAEAYNNLGLAQLKQGRPQKAASSFLAALRINPNYAEARRNLRVTLRTIKNGQAVKPDD